MIHVLIVGMMINAAPLELIKAEGELTLTDNASFFVFKADGTFLSFPNGMSGRTMKGTWTSPPGEPLRFEVLALQSWMNGASAPDDWRKLSFAIYDGKARPFSPQLGASVKKVFDGYWILEELSKAPKPAKK